jgi:PIN domain nuclease of toxin-antitoxin system
VGGGAGPGGRRLKPLLDTHVLLYWVDAPSRLTPSQARILKRVSATDPAWVSDITLWEVATLVNKGRIRLRLPVRDWLEAASAPPLVRRLSISPAVAAEVAALPETFHRDPADRIIVACARTAGATLLTQDRRIIESELVPTA